MCIRLVSHLDRLFISIDIHCLVHPFSKKGRRPKNHFLVRPPLYIT